MNRKRTTAIAVAGVLTTLGMATGLMVTNTDVTPVNTVTATDSETASLPSVGDDEPGATPSPSARSTSTPEAVDRDEPATDDGAQRSEARRGPTRSSGSTTGSTGGSTGTGSRPQPAPTVPAPAPTTPAPAPAPSPTQPPTLLEALLGL